MLRMDPFLKIKILKILAWSFAALFVLACGWLVYFNLQFSVYNDAQYKFSIRYPKTWKMIVHPRENVAVIFTRPKDTVMDKLQESFNVTVQPLPPEDTDLPSFSEAIKRQMTGVFGKSIDIVEDRSMQWDWHQGHEIVIEAPSPDHLVMVNAWVLSHGQSYILTFFGDLNKYANDLFQVNEMIRSFKLQ
jgi:hypothetical protein